MIKISIDMPKSCSKCFAYHEGSSYDHLPTRCEVMKKENAYCGEPIKNIDTFNEKPLWCPLIEVKEDEQCE